MSDAPRSSNFLTEIIDADQALSDPRTREFARGYLSPLGMALWDHRPGEELAFTINQNEFQYTVEAVEKADLKSL